MAPSAVNSFDTDSHRRVVAQFTRPRTIREAAEALRTLPDPHVDAGAHTVSGAAEYVKDLEADGLLKNVGTFESGKEALDAQDADKDVIDFSGSRELFKALSENPARFPYLDEDDHFVMTTAAHDRLTGVAEEDEHLLEDKEDRMTDIAVPHIDLPGGSLTGDEAFARVKDSVRDGLLGSSEKGWAAAADKFITWMAGFGDAVENKILDHIFNDGTYSAPTPYLALGTAAIPDSDIGATFGGTTEANYTSYARVAIAAGDMSAASAGSKTNSAVITFPGCTGSSSVVIAWCVVSAGPARLAAGDVIVFGTCTSTTINTTQTPPTVAASGLVVNLD